MKKRWLLLILALAFIALLAVYDLLLRNPDSEPRYTGEYKKQIQPP